MEASNFLLMHPFPLFLHGNPTCELTTVSSQLVTTHVSAMNRFWGCEGYFGNGCPNRTLSTLWFGWEESPSNKVLLFCCFGLWVDGSFAIDSSLSRVRSCVDYSKGVYADVFLPIRLTDVAFGPALPSCATHGGFFLIFFNMYFFSVQYTLYAVLATA